jgi:hypothetical protein
MPQQAKAATIALAENIGDPVGLRCRSVNFTNNQSDQSKVISLLSRNPRGQGAKKEVWPTPPLAGPNGSIPITQIGIPSVLQPNPQLQQPRDAGR